MAENLVLKEKREIEARGDADKTIDPANLEMFEIARKAGVETAFDRLLRQEPKCMFCFTGVSCRNCAMGPCRITAKADRGVCGATADVMVARGLLRNTIAGTASHVDHARHVALALLHAARGEAPYTIKDEGKLRRLGEALGIEGASSMPVRELAERVALIALEEIGAAYANGGRWLRMHATQERLETWERLGVLPEGGMLPVLEGMHRTSMGNDADPVNLVLGCIKAGIADGFYGLHLSTDLQDVLFGTPRPKLSQAGMGVLSEEHVNIACHGHVPVLSEKIVEAAEALQEEAKKAGAKGINVVGICCTGNEILERLGIPAVGNELNSELVIATGALDAVVVDYQCIFPALTQAAKCFHTKVITTAPIVKIPGAEHVEFDERRADEIAREIVMRAIQNFRQREQEKVHIPEFKTEVLAGFSVEALLEVLSKLNSSDPLAPLVDSIASGDIKGAVAIVGCSNPRVPHDLMHVELAKELIKRDILVLATGCAAHAHAKAGLMRPSGYTQAGERLQRVLRALGEAAGIEALPPVLHFGSCVDNSRINQLLKALAEKLGVAIKDLPVAASAPEYSTEKALSIGTWAVALGVTTHVNPLPRIMGSELVTELLTEKAEELLGARFIHSSDPKESAELLEKVILEKRRKLGLPA
ncbi:MAG: anaerobic carbon-monoxide dehydrogenase catalytic subunit [Euryarchaeota archaeon]|nr:anaerobic carbon-monoxide dehydrogenase catalytic subunit [Euryarchaeota archaeon]